MKKLNTIFDIAALIVKEKTEEISPAENELLQKWLKENEHNSDIYNKIKNDDLLISDLNELRKFDSARAFKKIEKELFSKEKGVKVFKQIPNYLKYAASIAVLVACSYFFYNQYETNGISEKTIVAGNQKAILITSDNTTIELDSTANKQVINGELAQIHQSGSTLSYSIDDTFNNQNIALSYNTLITPRGGEYNLVLSDGTEVMLNSSSKLRFPVVFNGNSREVELEGEAYFKVSKSKDKLFIVKTNNLNVNVYGTVFNVLAYPNENIIQTTLVEGSVGIGLHNVTSVINIKPGQQLTYNRDSKKAETKEVDTELYTGWTKGMFIFENEPIESILKTMSRWYNFDFEFKANNLKNQRFTLSLGRYDNINKILEMISISSDLKFTTKGNTIIVNSEN